MSAHITCQDVLDALYELIDCEECDRRSDLIDAGSVPGPNARARALMIQHVATCPHCTDALDAERHVRALMRGCYESEQASPALRARIVASISSVSVTWRSFFGDLRRRKRPVPWWFGLMCAKMLQSRQQTQGE